jgi:aryl-alcohol dehydrogenase-like predicted oxidoreductase
MTAMSRRAFGALAAAWLARPAGAAPAAAPIPAAPAAPILERAIPGTGERLPAVGLGTAVAYDRDRTEVRGTATAVVRALVEGGGRLIDTASSYGDAESVVGAVVAAAGLRDKVFLATKLEAPDPAELARSQARLQTKRLDLLQLHNVRDPGQSLAAFKAWKAQGACRYIGITSTFHGDFAALEAVLGRERPDFVQFDYSIDDRTAEARLLPAAAAAQAGVLTALPFGRGRLFRAVRGRPLPDWAAGFAGSWAQFFLKYLLADPRVTAVIPGTADAGHMADDVGALRGGLPDPDQRRRMAALIDGL